MKPTSKPASKTQSKSATPEKAKEPVKKEESAKKEEPTKAEQPVKKEEPVKEAKPAEAAKQAETKKSEEPSKKAEEPSKKEDEPQIEEGKEEKPAKKSERSIDTHKVEPALAYFPAHGSVKKETLIKIKQMYDSFDLVEADKEVEALKLDELLKGATKPEDVEGYGKLALRVKYWKPKALFSLGDEKSAKVEAESLLESLETQFEGLKKAREGLTTKKEAVVTSLEEPKSQIQEVETLDAPEFAFFIYLKLKFLLAKIQKAIGHNHLAHDTINEIFELTRKYKGVTPRQG